MRFTLHPQARVPGITPRPGPRHIPATPTPAALAQLMGALEARSPFCVAPTAPPGLETLADGQFATLTGGTSAAPKVILRRDASWTASFAVHAEIFDLGPADTVAILGTLDHSLALYAAVEALNLGAALLPLSGRAHADLARASVLYATPTQLRLLGDAPPCPRLRLLLCGAARLTPPPAPPPARSFPMPRSTCSTARQRPALSPSPTPTPPTAPSASPIRGSRFASPMAPSPPAAPMPLTAISARAARTPAGTAIG
ncbi:hypothetical protein [Sulfitobacter albidus]|uniref:hypothetical protein n=1 Tax=Sulfitobacter albidus TaxID=2829501 RepID=UPI0032B00EE9